VKREGALPPSDLALGGVGLFEVLFVWCALALVGCGRQVVEPLPAPTAAPRPTHTAAPRPTLTPAPVAEATTEAEQLVAQGTSRAPAIDGQVESLWEAAAPLSVPLTWGAEGTAHALDVELRALHDEQRLYLLARWEGERGAEGTSAMEEATVYNRFTVHWRIPAPDAERVDCTVVCHTVFADGQGRVAYGNAETIPHGGGETLQVAGGWQAAAPGSGGWTLEWSRPLVSANPFDLQMADRERGYDFMVKVFARVEGRPDPISRVHRLVFAESGG
jgi:hypothetical protein